MRASAFVALLVAATTMAQDILVPLDVQATLFLKILSFDRKVQSQSSQPMRIGVLYQPRVRTSRDVFEGFQRAVTKSGMKTVAGRSLTLVPIDIDGEADIAGQLGREPLDALYVTPLRAVSITAITDVTRHRGITTLTGVPEYVTAGLAIGLDVRGQKPEIMVNLLAQKAEGADFSAQLLKMARVIQ